MENNQSTLSRQEEIILNLRGLFSRYGYQCCHVSTFEEYDFYVTNRSALLGDEVLVFKNADGRLMTLKPDVTMSIVKNVKDGAPGLQKICYNENVYRIPTGGGGFRETVQTGLECIGSLDDYAVSEVLMLAAKSLAAICPSFILDVSHVGILDGLLDLALPEGADRMPILKAMEQKNGAGLQQLCTAYGVKPWYAEALRKLLTLYGPIQQVLPQVEALAEGEKMHGACAELREILEQMLAYGLEDKIHLDFSIRGGTDYYSGLLLRGFVDGVASPVLWGGRYDKLIHRMGKKAGGIGFAVYLDQLERRATDSPDEEVLLIYSENEAPVQVIQTVSQYQAKGLRVRAERQIPQGSRYGKLVKLENGEVTEIE